MNVVVRGERHLLRLPAARPFAFAVCGSDFKGSCRLESIFRALSSPFSRLSRVQRTSKSRLAQGGKRRGTEEVQRARTGRTDRSLLCRSRLRPRSGKGHRLRACVTAFIPPAEVADTLRAIHSLELTACKHSPRIADPRSIPAGKLDSCREILSPPPQPEIAGDSPCSQQVSKNAPDSELT
jgi:hypothetical protein